MTLEPNLSADILRPRVLILASRFDLSCDYVVSALRALGVPYLRLNTEDLPTFKLEIDPIRAVLRGTTHDFAFEIPESQLSGIYFRQPTFLREAALVNRPVDEQFRRAQWGAFLRSLLVFRRCAWVNHPVSTYEAEHKAVQLRAAAELGFDVPKTRIANSAEAADEISRGQDHVAVKGLDTVLVREGETESFGYTNLISVNQLRGSELHSAPFILQESVREKLDLRVTVVADSAWSACVTLAGNSIVGDWRLAKTDAEFTCAEIPRSVSDRCVALVRHLGLRFGAIDIALSEGRYYFLEINPTGEWAWLQESLKFPIAKALAAALAGPTGTSVG